MQDAIERELIINAPQERVYAAITDPTQIVKWFPNAIEGGLMPGERPVLDFGEDGKNQIYVVAAEPHRYFSYRWVAGSNHVLGDVLTMPSTLVVFFLENVEGATKLILKESGFAALTSEVAEKSLQQNTGGWGYMLGRLEQLFAQQ